MKFFLPVAALSLDFLHTQLHLGPADVVIGHLKHIVENYVDTYNEHETECKNQEDSMKALVDAAIDIESKKSILDEKAKLAKECDKTLVGKAGMVKTLDEALNTLQPHQNWLDAEPKLQTKVQDIYSKHPAATVLLSTKPQDVPALLLEATEQLLK